MPRSIFCKALPVIMKKTEDPATILVIDRDPLTLTAVAAALHLVGYECHCARDSEAALKAARGLELDLVICDVDLEEVSGFDLGREIRQQPGQTEVPMIFVSARDNNDPVRQAHDAGGMYFLRKPFDPDVLLELVDKALWMPHLVHSRMRRTASALAN